MPEKLFAEWFWIDRWVGSSAFSLPLEARGLYREMLTQAWRRGAQLPNDHEQIRRMTGVTIAEWKRSWPLVKGYWKSEGSTLVNRTQVEVYKECKIRVEKSLTRARRGAAARWKPSSSNAQAHAQASAQASAQAHAQAPTHPEEPDANHETTPENGANPDAQASAQALLEHCDLDLDLYNNHVQPANKRDPAANAAGLVNQSPEPLDPMAQVKAKLRVANAGRGKRSHVRFR